MSTFIHPLADVQSKNIGENAMIGAGSVICQDVEPNTTHIDQHSVLRKERK